MKPQAGSGLRVAFEVDLGSSMEGLFPKPVPISSAS